MIKRIYVCFLAAVAIALIVISGGCSGSAGTLQYNYREIDITPDGSVALAGLSARKGLSAGIHTPVKSKCLVISDGDQKVCIISNDLLELWVSTADLLREEIARESGLDAGNIFIHCTHTHSGPAVDGEFTEEGMPNHQYAMEAKRAIVRNAVEAILDKGSYSPFTMELGVGESFVNSNRKDAGALTDRDVYLLRLVDESGNPSLSLVNYACHPVTLHSGNKMVSTDFPGFTVSELEREWGGDVMYLTGASGNSNPSDSLSRHCSYAELKGKMLADDIKGIEFSTVKDNGKLKVLNAELKFPFMADSITVELIESHVKEITKGEDPSSSSWIKEVESWSGRIFKDMERGRVRDSLPIRASVVNVGGVLLVFSQGEPYMDYQAELREEFPDTPILFIAYTNGQSTYLPAKYAFGSEIYDYDTKMIHVDTGTPYPLTEEMPDLYSRGLKEAVSGVAGL